MTQSIKVLAINPNSSESVTHSVLKAMQRVQPACGAEFIGQTCDDGPPGIVTQADFDDAAQRMAARAARGFDGDFQAVVIACFSDPGLQSARSHGDLPIIGLGEAGMRRALQAGRRVGVVAVADAAIPRHLAYWERLGIAGRVVGERALNLSVAASGDAAQAFGRMHAAALVLRDELHADAILLGCAGMSALRERLQQSIGIAVIDPCEAAAAAALLAAKERGAGGAA